jgi:hypothetical protein
MMGLGLASWIWLIFWRSTTVPSAISLAWVITAYLIFEPVTAALTVFRKDRWFAAVFDLLTAVALFIEMVLVIYDQQSLGVMGARLESAYLLLFATFGGLIVDLLVTLIVNTRIFASSSN